MILRHMWFDAAALVAAVLAGAVASIAGFGIGSLLTPLFALQLGTRLAVAAVSIPHLAGTAVRFWLLRGHVDRRTFIWFGLASAGGGLIGALLHADASNRALAIVLGALLILAGISSLTGFMQRIRLGRRGAWFAGALSGAFGGLVGNQGGIRSAALLTFDADKETFVATATAVGLIVDGARMPVYLAIERRALQDEWRLIAIATTGVLIGTLAGRRLLARIPDAAFRRILAVLLLMLGGWMLVRG